MGTGKVSIIAIAAGLSKVHFNEIVEVLKKEGDHEWAMIDVTIIRAHQHSSGARGGKSFTGFSTKIHVKGTHLEDY
ncbi:hypothetical protein BJP41_09395 [Candidatus Williamhamiltonella defendens]|uniref:Transposase n=1 Tax=Candidatus Williamhamiltonella defendens TaxID=138072 RepID=A0A2D3T4P6_9ENTR|nr:hypothetical protein BJP41_09395 [Candidatus Hamiltonella defensa]ATW32510.1 hypothetical protein BJP42_09705 [Candidatus Hamiltonella defensa]